MGRKPTIKCSGSSFSTSRQGEFFPGLYSIRPLWRKPAVLAVKNYETINYKGKALEVVTKQVIGAKEVAEALDISESKAYVLIRQLNSELSSKGYLTVRGKVSRAYFNDKMYGGNVPGDGANV